MIWWALAPSVNRYLFFFKPLSKSFLSKKCKSFPSYCKFANLSIKHLPNLHRKLDCSFKSCITFSGVWRSLYSNYSIGSTLFKKCQILTPFYRVKKKIAQYSRDYRVTTTFQNLNMPHWLSNNSWIELPTKILKWPSSKWLWFIFCPFLMACIPPDHNPSPSGSCNNKSRMMSFVSFCEVYFDKFFELFLFQFSRSACDFTLRAFWEVNVGPEGSQTINV